MEKLKQLEENVLAWATELNFFGEGGATLFAQYLKLREEFGELSGNFARGRCMKDDIGDCAVVVIIMNKLINNSFRYSDLESDGYKDWIVSTSIQDKYLGIDKIISSFVDEERLPNYGFRKEWNFSGLFFELKGFAEQAGYDFTECLEFAYNEIKDRKGEWRNNVFVKESDLKK